MTPAQFESLRIVADTMTQARFGATVMGQPARIIPETEHRKAMAALLTLLREDVGERDALASVSWRVGQNFGEWHRQAEPDRTRCGKRVPVRTAIVGYGIATSVRPVDGCRICWAEAPAAVPAGVVP